MKKVYFHTLGCKVNQYDTQAMLEKFLENGYCTASTPQEADVCVINTCTVTGTADKKSLQIANRQKKLNKNCELIITGCMSQNKSDLLLSTGARLILGTQNRNSIVPLFNKAIEKDIQLVAVDSLEGTEFESLIISSHSEHTRAIIKIQEGCDYNCSYCIIPSVRGKVRSRLIPEIIAEAKSLSRAGYKEIVLAGINLTCYGNDLKTVNICDVIEELEKIDGIKRIRISSFEPNLVTEEIAKRLSKCEKLCPHFHLALQSGSDFVLSKMRRRYNTDRFFKSTVILRNYFKNCSLTTDVIVGFPNESEENFNETVEFVKKIRFLKTHIFPFSPREGTDAAKMDQIDNSIKKSRVRKLISITNKISDEIHNESIGKIYNVLLEEQIDKNTFIGFTDNYLKVKIIGDYKSGEMIKVKIINKENELLLGEKINYDGLHILQNIK